MVKTTTNKKKSTKKTTPKVVSKSQKTSTKEQIAAKQFGRTIVMSIDGRKYSRSIADKEERDNILKSVESFNKANTPTKKSRIISSMEKDKTAKKAETKAAKKSNTKTPTSSKPKPKASKGTPTDEEIAEARAVLARIPKAKSAPSSKRSSGEY